MTNGAPKSEPEKTSKVEPVILDFLRPKLTGSRFEGHAIPLELLKDLSAIEDLIVELAKWQFLRNHPDRKRSPRGFTDGVSLQLTNVEEGSAIPVIGLVILSQTAGLFGHEHQEYFLQARDSLIEAIAAAESEDHRTIRVLMPDRALSFFDRIGRSLQSDECMAFSYTGSEKTGKLTKATRRSLVFASSKNADVTEEISVRASVYEADAIGMTFQVLLDDGRKVAGSMSSDLADTVIEALKAYKTDKSKVLIQGIGRYSKTNRLERIDSVDQIQLLDPRDIATRLDEFKQLRDGWLDGKGVAPNANSLDWLAAALEANTPDDAELPYLYPTETGGVLVEWATDGSELSLDVNLEERTGEWHVMDFSTDTDSHEIFDLNSEISWQKISQTISKVNRGSN